MIPITIKSFELLRDTLLWCAQMAIQRGMKFLGGLLKRVQRACFLIRMFDYSPYLLDFKPSYYKKPKAVPTPQEDRTRTSMQKEVFLGEATIGESVVSYKEALKTLAGWIRELERPTVVVGPLLFWDFCEKSLQEKAKVLRELIEKVEKFNVKVLPDYKPKLKKYNPNVEIDPPNPVIRLLRKHTDTKVVALCGLYGHPTAHLSTSFTDAEKLEDLKRLL